MSDIDFMGGDAIAVIERSLRRHPSLFRETLEAAAKDAERFARGTPIPEVAKAARAMATCCWEASALIISDLPHLPGLPGTLAVALNAASKLQCLSNYERNEILRRTEGASNA